MNRFARFAALFCAVIALFDSAHAVGPDLSLIGQYHTGIFDAGACEISAYDPASQRLFVVSAAASSILILDLSDPTNPVLLNTINGAIYGGSFNSVAVRNGVVAAAVEAVVKQDPGAVVFFDANGVFLAQYPAGALPDMVTFTPDGNYVLTANEGEPNDAYTVDPEGSVTIINISGGVIGAPVMTASFSSFIGQEAALRAQGIRIFGPGANAAMDFEPEYITVNSSSSTAYVTLQENNAIAVIDIATAAVTDIHPLGYKNHNLPGNRLDASNQDAGINLQNWPIYGMYLPDGIASYEVSGETYLVTANEGDTREWAGYTEFGRLRSFITSADPVAFPNWATLRNNVNLGRLNVTGSMGDTDNDGDFDEIYCFGGRSFSIWDENGALVFDSGEEFELRLSGLLPTEFNSTNDENGSFDARSDDKGPEPESVVIADYCGRKFAFIGLERVGGIMIYDITDPANSYYVDYVTSRDFSVNVDGGDPATLEAVVELGPEGLLWIDAASSPNGQSLLICSNEINGSVTIYSAVCDEVLPVEFGSFEAVAGNNEVKLNWNTRTESDNERFEITRDGAIVTNIASLGNSASGHSYSWTDNDVANGLTYSYSLTSIALDGTRELLASASATPTANAGLPLAFALNPAYPNPFNPTTSLSYSLPAAAHVVLQIFDINGREVATLVDGAMNAGTYHVQFDAAELSSGLYFARISAGSFSSSQKLVLMK